MQTDRKLLAERKEMACRAKSIYKRTQKEVVSENQGEEKGYPFV